MPTTRSQAILADDATTDAQGTSKPKTRELTGKGAKANATTTDVQGTGKPKARKKPSKGIKANDAPQIRLPSSVVDSPLFRLPPELRNMIYRFALTTDGEVTITESGGTPEPALLSVNKTLRSETYQIFYFENKFCFAIENFSPVTLLLAERKILQSGPRTGIRDPGLNSIVRQRSWKNLVWWLHLCLEGTCGD